MLRQGFGAVGFGLTIRRQGVGGGCVGCGLPEAVALVAEGTALLDADALASGAALETSAVGMAVALGSAVLG